VKGSFAVKNREIDGSFELGVTEELVNSFPGAKERVFTANHDGYFWTKVKISGPLNHPQDDLKPRLIAAAEEHFSKKLFGSLLKPGGDVLRALKELY
jgi:hypothetical protein